MSLPIGAKSWDDICLWKWEDAQFAGGPWWWTQCDDWIKPMGKLDPKTCSKCGKLVAYQEDENKE